MKNEKYNAGVFSFNAIKKYFDEYDVIVTLGCDCLITNFDVPITSFSSNYVAVSQESAFSKKYGTYCNGEIMIFNKKDDGLIKILDIFEELQAIERNYFRQNNIETP